MREFKSACDCDLFRKVVELLRLQRLHTRKGMKNEKRDRDGKIRDENKTNTRSNHETKQFSILLFLSAFIRDSIRCNLDYTLGCIVLIVHRPR